jgi:hypothetical protein
LFHIKKDAVVGGWFKPSRVEITVKLVKACPPCGRYLKGFFLGVLFRLLKTGKLLTVIGCGAWI